MTVRSTYALDEATAQRIRELAEVWHVSQAEVVRRSVQQAAAAHQARMPTPADVIAHYQQRPLLRPAADTRRRAATSRRLRQAADVTPEGRSPPYCNASAVTT